jgi:microcystin-dependent protein
MQGNAPMHPGQGPGLSLHDLGETGGSDTVTLLESEIPSHAHAINGNISPSQLAVPSPTRSFARSNPGNAYTAATTPITQFSTSAIAPAGGGQPHNNRMPYLTLSFNIALQGVYPPRT